MKYLMLMMLFPLTVFAQSHKDYDKAFGSFVKFYNKENWQGVCSMMSSSPNDRCMWKDAGHVIKKHGKIIKYQYLGVDTSDPERVIVYKVTFANKKEEAVSFNFDTEDKRYFGTFRFTTESDEILRMLKSK